MATIPMLALSCAEPSPVMAPPSKPTAKAALPEPEPAAASSSPAVSTVLEPAQAPVVEPAASPFLAVVKTKQALQLLPVEGALLVAHQAYGDDFYGIEMGVVDGKGIEFLDRLRIDGMEFLREAHGTWPSDVDLLSTSTNGRTGIATRYRLTNAGWNNQDNDMGRAYIGVAERSEGVLAMKTGTFPPSPPAFVTLRGNPGPRPKLRTTPASCAQTLKDNPMMPKVEVYPYAFGGTKTGALFVAGSHCDRGRGSVLEAWKPGSTKSEVVDLPEVELDEESFFADGATDDEVLLLTDKRVVRISGSTFATVSIPGPSIDASMVDIAAYEQSLWVLVDNRVFERTDHGWKDVPLPSGIKATGIAWHDGVLWAAAEKGLFRMKRAGDDDVGVAIDASADSVVPKALQLPRMGGPTCSNNLVVLYQFTEVTPVDYDFPLTRKALKGHTELANARFLVTEDNGKKYFTAATSSFTDAVKLADIVRKGVQGAAPTVVCASPKVIRQLKIDLRTGAVVEGSP